MNYIYAVNYKEKNNHDVINKVKLTRDIDKREDIERTKDEIINKINKENIVHYTLKKDGGKGEKVHVFKGKYIRTDPNDEECDNLGGLEEF